VILRKKVKRAKKRSQAKEKTGKKRTERMEAPPVSFFTCLLV
jgi:hypothetical protein